MKDFYSMTMELLPLDPAVRLPRVSVTVSPWAVLVEEFCGCVCAMERCDAGSDGDRSWEPQGHLRNVALASLSQDFRQKDLLVP